MRVLIGMEAAIVQIERDSNSMKTNQIDVGLEFRCYYTAKGIIVPSTLQAR